MPPLAEPGAAARPEAVRLREEQEAPHHELGHNGDAQGLRGEAGRSPPLSSSKTKNLKPQKERGLSPWTSRSPLCGPWGRGEAGERCSSNGPSKGQGALRQGSPPGRSNHLIGTAGRRTGNKARQSSAGPLLAPHPPLRTYGTGH
jgi:hypothetical protein